MNGSRNKADRIKMNVSQEQNIGNYKFAVYESISKIPQKEK